MVYLKLPVMGSKVPPSPTKKIPIKICIQARLFRDKVFSTSQNYTAYLYLINTVTYGSHWDTCQVGQPSVRHFHSWYKVHPGTSPRLVRSGHSVDLWQLGWKEEWRIKKRGGGREERRKREREGGREGGRERGRELGRERGKERGSKRQRRWAASDYFNLPWRYWIIHLDKGQISAVTLFHEMKRIEMT